MLRVGAVLRSGGMAPTWQLCASDLAEHECALAMVICLSCSSSSHVGPGGRTGLGRVLSGEVVVGGGVLRQWCWFLG